MISNIIFSIGVFFFAIFLIMGYLSIYIRFKAEEHKKAGNSKMNYIKMLLEREKPHLSRYTLKGKHYLNLSNRLIIIGKRCLILTGVFYLLSYIIDYVVSR